METVIKLPADIADDTSCISIESMEDVQKAVDILNGIAAFIAREGWKEGMRNNMAVDACIALYALDKFVKDKPDEMTNIITDLVPDALDEKDRNDLYSRVWVIQDYLIGWDRWGKIFDFTCMNPTFWKTEADQIEGDMPVVVKAA